MTIKIKEMYGYNLSYDERLRRFIILDTDGTELAHANTQDEAEVKAKALSKQDFKRIRIVKVEQEGQMTMGELTSLNKDDESAWVSMEKSSHGWGSGRRKIALAYDKGYYEATEVNLKIVEDIKAKEESLNHIKAEIKALITTLEKPINMGYFGITK